MRAAIYQGENSIGIREVSVPDPKPGHVLLEMRQSGICGTDLHHYLGRWQQPATATGHEVGGVVVQCGEGVTNVVVGDRVCVEGFRGCGTCRYCRVGMYNLCENWEGTAGDDHSGFAEYVIAHASSLFHLPDNMSFEEGAMVEPLAVGWRVFGRSQASYRDSVAVIGGGTIGLLTAAVARVCGVRQVIACVKYQHQAEMAKQLGVDHVVRVPAQDVKEQVLQVTDGLGADVVIEATASAQGFHDALAAVRSRGTVVVTGSYTTPLELDLQPIVLKELTLTSSMCYGYTGMRKDFEWAIDLISSGKIAAGKLVTHRFPLADIDTAFATAADKQSGAIKVQVYNETATN